MVRALSTAQTQSVREITKKADIKKVNKKVSVIIVIFFILLIIGFIAYQVYNYYQENKFDFKETEKGITFYSKDMPVRNALISAIDNNTIIVSADTLLDHPETIGGIIEPTVLLTTIFIATDKNVININNVVDGNGNLLGCSTNYGDRKTEATIGPEECLAIMENTKTIVVLYVPDSNLKESRVNIYPLEKRIEIISKNNYDMYMSSYLLLKSSHSNFDAILESVEHLKKKISDLIDSNQLVIDSNTTDSNEIDANQIDLNN